MSSGRHVQLAVAAFWLAAATTAALGASVSSTSVTMAIDPAERGYDSRECLSGHVVSGGYEIKNVVASGSSTERLPLQSIFIDTNAARLVGTGWGIGITNVGDVPVEVTLEIRMVCE